MTSPASLPPASGLPTTDARSERAPRSLHGRDEAVALVRLDVLDVDARLAVAAARIDREADRRAACGHLEPTKQLAAHALAARAGYQHARRRVAGEGLAGRALRGDQRHRRGVQRHRTVGAVAHREADERVAAAHRLGAQIETLLIHVERLDQHLDA